MNDLLWRLALCLLLQMFDCHFAHLLSVVTWHGPKVILCYATQSYCRYGREAVGASVELTL